MELERISKWLAVVLLAGGMFPAVGLGQDEAESPSLESVAAEIALVEGKADEAALAGHNSWMLTSTALVLFMTAPGLALFYGGLVRKKNVLGVIMQCIFLMGLMTVIWALWGYSLAFGGDGAWIGNDEYLFMNRVSRTWDEPFTDTDGNGTCNEGEEYEDLNANGSYDTGPSNYHGGCDPATDAHAVPRHVLHHYAGVDLRRVCRTHEVQHDGRLHACSGARWCTARCATGCGMAASWQFVSSTDLSNWPGRQWHGRRRIGLCRRHRGPHQFRRLGADRARC
jgi:hypothetical protein